jgi:hypothetical protein
VPSKRFKQFALAFLALLAIGFVAVVSLAWYFLPLGPFLDDGPFHGVAAPPIVDRLPSQSFAIFNGFALEVFDPSEEGVSPVVQLRDQSDAIRWAIRADGYKSGDVQSMRFTNSHRGIARSGAVEGWVQWTYGREYSVWFITGNGKLRDYWYSW